MRKLLAVILSLVLSCTAAVSLADSKISVSGNGTALVPADTAVVSLGVNARDKDVLKAQQKANETIAAIRTVLAENGIRYYHITTSEISISVTVKMEQKLSAAIALCREFNL